MQRKVYEMQYGNGRRLEKISERLLYRTQRQQRQRYQRLHERIEATPEISSGMRPERRVFSICCLVIALNTCAPIDPSFDGILDISLIGMRLLESETL